jgi:hypothetical protein
MAPIPGTIIPGARGKDLHPRSSCQRVEECPSAFFRGPGSHEEKREAGRQGEFVADFNIFHNKVFLGLG